jgi:predicted Zn-dependent protease
LSKADACIVIGRRQTTVNVRWANNTVTTNGVMDQDSLAVVSVVGRRVAAVSRTYLPPDRLEDIVRESEAACERRPDAPDYMPLVGPDGDPADWDRPAASTDVGAVDRFVPQLGATFERAREARLLTFGYAELTAWTTWLAVSTGLRRRHSDRIGRVAMTAKTPDFARSTWTGAAARDLRSIDPGALFGTLERRLAWSTQQIDRPVGHYEVLFEPSCTADLALGAYSFMSRREADEGRNPFSRAGGGTRIGERMFGDVSIYSDPHEPDLPATPFHVGIASDDASSVFDNGLPTSRTQWVRDGVLGALATPRYWAAKAAGQAVPLVDNLVVPGTGPTLEEMIARTKRALLVTSLWYIRTVDPQTALLTGLTRDGVFLVEDGEIRGAVNNFRWNMSPIVALAQATEIGRSEMSLPREHDEFLRTKTPPVRVEHFNMSSVSEAS